MKRRKLRTGLWLLVVLAACTREPARDRSQALRLVSAPRLADDLGRADLVQKLNQHAAFLASLQTPAVLQFGERRFSARDYAAAVEAFLSRTAALSDDGAFFRALEESFDFWEVYGGRRWGEIVLTSYFEPEIPGRVQKTADFDTPLLRRPADLVQVLTSQFDERLAEAGTLRGRLQRDDRGRQSLVPYPAREAIQQGALRGQKLEIAWTRPVDAFFMQVQGSGTVVLPDGRRLRLGYSDQNGQLYQSIGKFLTDAIPLEKMSLYAIETHLAGLPRAQVQAVLNKNPSFVFFEHIDGDPKTSLGNTVFAGRTLATDPRFFPKGALAFAEFKKPVFEGADSLEPGRWQDTARFVFDQDTGGAIKGTARADLFWGAGSEAKRHAGFMKDPARLYYLSPRPIPNASP